MPCLRRSDAHLHFVARQAAALDAVALLVLAFPEEGRLLGCGKFGHVVELPWFLSVQSTVTRLISSSVVMPMRTLLMPAWRRPQTPSRGGLLLDVQHAAARHDDAADLLGDRHHLVDSRAPLIPVRAVGCNPRPGKSGARSRFPRPRSLPS